MDTCIYINKTEDLEKLRNLNSNNGYLVFFTRDLDFKGRTIEPIFINGSNVIINGCDAILSDFVVNRNGNYAGLFNTLTDNNRIVIKNLNIENAYVRAQKYAGILAGRLNGSIIDCDIQGEVECLESAGGLVGISDELQTISNHIDVQVASISYAGGIVGKVGHMRAINNNLNGEVISCNYSDAEAGYMGYGIIRRPKTQKVKIRKNN